MMVDTELRREIAPGRVTAPPGPALVAVRGLCYSYGSWRAVRDVSFELGPGVTGLLGPNGAGKTTLLSCLAGITSWVTGSVRVDGVDLSRRPAQARRRIGFMPERVAFPADMRVVEYLRFVAAVKSVPRRSRAEEIAAVLATTGLGASRDRIIANLSKGNRQRVGLAQALLGRPPVVILDEPTAGLDPLNALEIRDVLADSARDRCVLISTHHLPEARLMCDRVIVMSRGAVVYDGAPGGMARARGGLRRVRLELRRVTDGPTARPALGPGVELVHGQPDGQGWSLVVDVADDAALGAEVRRLAAAWQVVGVEATTDVAEDAFRHAVLGDSSGEGAA
ncbi:MAG TPA: ABC transporter ATP-binding protein [Acidimicrobiia bacterium]|jgi:ABC-2 type transport system ATP-binding protein|nr:ABC transporter ATP-binding protein [Acidimicrobiia bacterium]